MMTVIKSPKPINKGLEIGSNYFIPEEFSGFFRFYEKGCFDHPSKFRDFEFTSLKHETTFMVLDIKPCYSNTIITFCHLIMIDGKFGAAFIDEYDRKYFKLVC